MKALFSKKGLIFGLVVVGGLVIGALWLYRSTDETQSTESQTAILNEITGLVQVKLDPDQEMVQAANGQVIHPGGEVVTGADGRLRIDVSNGTFVRVAENSTFVFNLEQTETGPLLKLRLSFGQVWIVLKGGGADVDTPSGVASVRGSYMSVSSNALGEVDVTCLEGTCTLVTNTGTIEMVAGQTATVENINLPPMQGVMNDEQVQEWLNTNPEATVIVPALTATVRAVLELTATPSHVQLPDLVCLLTNSCESYCYPVGWDKDSGEPPPMESIRQDCRDAGQAMVDQGVDPDAFLTCIVGGGDPQACADNSVKQ